MRLVRRAEGRGIDPPHRFSRLEQEFDWCGTLHDRDQTGLRPYTKAERAHGEGAEPLSTRVDAIAESGGAVASASCPNTTRPPRFQRSAAPFNWLKLLLRLKRGTRSAVCADGRAPQLRRRAARRHGALMVIHSLQQHGRARGMERAELSWILEDNLPMRRMIEAIGGIGYKTYRIYEKTLA